MVLVQQPLQVGHIEMLHGALSSASATDQYLLCGAALKSQKAGPRHTSLSQEEQAGGMETVSIDNIIEY